MRKAKVTRSQLTAPPERPLTLREEKFADEYVRDLNGTKAAQRVGCARKSAHVQASRWLRNPKIAARIQKKMDERSKRLEINADNVLREIHRLAMSDLRRIASWNKKGVKLKSSSTITDEDAAFISEISQVEDTRSGKKSLKVKLHDKTSNLHLLARHLRLIGTDDAAAATADETAVKIKQLLGEMDSSTGGSE